MENFICNQYGGKLTILDTENIIICKRITKVEAITLQFVSFSCICAEYLQKICIFNFVFVLHNTDVKVA